MSAGGAGGGGAGPGNVGYSSASPAPGYAGGVTGGGGGGGVGGMPMGHHGPGTPVLSSPQESNSDINFNMMKGGPGPNIQVHKIHQLLLAVSY